MNYSRQLAFTKDIKDAMDGLMSIREELYPVVEGERSEQREALNKAFDYLELLYRREKAVLTDYERPIY